MTIEEAWEDIAEAGLCLHHGPSCHPFEESWKDLHDAAVALALAVLEEAVASANFIAGEGAIMDGHTLRARIEALGDADDN